MIERMLLAVDDTPDSLAAARVAVELAGALGARVRVVHVSADHLLDRAVQEVSARASVAVRREAAAVAMLRRTTVLAEHAGVAVEAVLVAGAVGPAVLDAARDWPADLVVMGKSARSASGEPYVGTQTRHVLEFAEAPVLVVPAAR